MVIGNYLFIGNTCFIEFDVVEFVNSNVHGSNVKFFFSNS